MTKTEYALLLVVVVTALVLGAGRLGRELSCAFRTYAAQVSGTGPVVCDLGSDR